MNYIIDSSFKVTPVTSSTLKIERDDSFQYEKNLPKKMIGVYKCEIGFDDMEGLFDVYYNNSETLISIYYSKTFEEANYFLQTLTIESLEKIIDNLEDAS